MKVYLTSAYPYSSENCAREWLTHVAESDPFGEHRIIDDPDEADLIIFVEGHPWFDPYFFRVLLNPLYRKHRRKCVVYHDADYALPIMRGVYPSIERRAYQETRTRSFHYLARLCVNESIRYSAPGADVPYLFSFVGAGERHSSRLEIMRLTHPRSLLKDTGDLRAWLMSAGSRKCYWDSFATSISLSKFVLCPRGRGPTSYRLYEAMEMGRAPVIIADEWVPFAGPDWDAFSLRIPEGRIREIPALLEAAERRWQEMGLRARREWEQWISPEVSFHRLTETCAAMTTRSGWLDVLTASRAWIYFAEPFHLKNLLRHFKNNYLHRMRGAGSVMPEPQDGRTL